MSKQRFVETYNEGIIDTYKIIVDTETGVNYLHIRSGFSTSITVLLDQDGKPIITNAEK
ncbi:TPA: xylan 1,4-beta-xylosidase [Clostridium botulinum]|nr:xylan 1,4-beta-xylosidase [Clostridium botulinum]NFD33439.1 xylan 1,4-beta-xylosidase [Clostridium botulinum]NFD60680.1 xylan 1,4-beta-xylosidase [Clostridium botulinum]NFE00576.1 xylan 1,4-beta-xylosidase [Clostridium botulinum]HDK7177964.1 xylan 1,4-beta-xylosidase [Clostridium botulinum]